MPVVSGLADCTEGRAHLAVLDDNGPPGLQTERWRADRGAQRTCGLIDAIGNPSPATARKLAMNRPGSPAATSVRTETVGRLVQLVDAAQVPHEARAATWFGDVTRSLSTTSTIIDPSRSKPCRTGPA